MPRLATVIATGMPHALTSHACLDVTLGMTERKSNELKEIILTEYGPRIPSSHLRVPLSLFASCTGL